MPEIEFDRINGMAYIRISKNEIESSIEMFDDTAVFDLDKDGELVGIEILSVDRFLERLKNRVSDVLTEENIPIYLLPEMYRQMHKLA